MKFEKGRTQEKSVFWLRAPDDSLRPKTASTGGKEVASAILFVRQRKVTTGAKDTMRKAEAPHPLAKGYVFWSIPKIGQRRIIDVADDLRV